MSSKKSNQEKYNNDNDLNFMPLNIDSSLAPNSTKFPLLFNIDGISVTKSYGAISLGFPNLNINPSPMPLNFTTPTEMAPLTPYPNSIPNIDTTTPLNGSSSNNTPSSGNTSSNNTPSGLEYPTESSDDFLYSYNEPKVNERYLDNSVNVLDILRNFDMSLDFTSDSRKNTYTEEDINSIFSSLEKDNAGILATMKAYRIPYPIAKLLIKKIIKISLDNCKG